MATATKRCPACKVDQPLSNYQRNRTMSDGLQSQCRPCRNAITRRWMSENKDDQRKKALVRKHVKQDFINACKSVPCVDCGQTFPPCVMHFDHVRGTKLNTVSQLLARNATLTAIQREIEKCDVRCANCHAIRHHCVDQTN